MPEKRNSNKHRSLDLTSAKLFYRELDIVPEMTREEEKDIYEKQELVRFLMLKAILSLPYGRHRMVEPLLKLAMGREVREFVIDKSHWRIRKGILCTENRENLLNQLHCLQVRYPKRKDVRNICLNWANVEMIGKDIFADVETSKLLLKSRRELLDFLGMDISSAIDDAISYEYSDAEMEHDCWERYPELKTIENQLDLIEVRIGVSIAEYIHQARVFGDAIRKHCDILERLVEAHLRLVISRVRQYYIGDALEEMDLVQEGCYGLLEAVKRFDINRGYRFSTYAVWWIKQAILRALAKQTRLIRLPIHVIEENKMIKAAVDRFWIEHNRTPDIEELATYMEIEDEQIINICLATTPTLSLDSAGGVENTVLADFLEGGLTLHDPSILQEDMRGRLDEALQSLSDREKTIISLRFGLLNDDLCTLRDLARIFKVSRERIRQIEERALAKLREHGLFKDLKENGS